MRLDNLLNAESMILYMNSGYWFENVVVFVAFLKKILNESYKGPKKVLFDI